MTIFAKETLEIWDPFPVLFIDPSSIPMKKVSVGDLILRKEDDYFNFPPSLASANRNATLLIEGKANSSIEWKSSAWLAVISSISARERTIKRERERERKKKKRRKNKRDARGGQSFQNIFHWPSIDEISSDCTEDESRIALTTGTLENTCGYIYSSAKLVAISINSIFDILQQFLFFSSFIFNHV